ncbi:hypothetical protein PPERSA_08351 [Pseudocohnilembus persalinus]|uniref:Uncharacterized protein n=1 Tax=Pseudocohnilembus persalinus TaxID=266149 RepID=A0A0V0QPV9_PSEPJ|nr:hypothetical protein PPERSA_08351 [Pseudocohnilembus persalinus]|eukprot:KRX04136.1 hypothetical protein PPERSA_08351 [Pseudocohnilembus persalinus]
MNKIYQNLPQKTENQDQKLNQNADTIQPDLTKKNKLKNIINKQKIVESKPNKIKNFETIAKIVLLSKKAQSRIEQEKIKALKALENRRKTISKFCFKETEKDEDPFLIPIMKKITQGENNGSMNVCELWSDKNMKKYLTFSNMTDGKFALRAIAKANQLTQQKQKQPYTFTNKEQNHFKGESDIYGDQARSRIRQEFEKQKDYINFYHQQNEQKNLLDNIKVDSNYIKHYYQAHYQIQNDQKHLWKSIFHEIKQT